MLCLQDLRPDTKMVETCIPLCKECMALTIGDKIMDYLSKDFPSDPQHHSGPPELMVEWQKWDTIPSLSNLTAAADAGCQFCAFLLVFILRCCDKYVFSDQLYCEKDFEDAQMSVKIDQVRYVREHDPNVIGYLGSTRQDHRRLVGLAADIRIYSRNSQEEFCYTTAWFPLSSEDGTLNQIVKMFHSSL